MSVTDPTSGPTRPRRTTRDRHDAILAELSDRGRIEVAALATALDVAEETVRRDLRQLERREVLVRVHGGAVLPSSTVIGSVPDEGVSEDDPLVAAVLGVIPDTGAFFLGPGRVSTAVAAAVPYDEDVSIVTTSIAISQLAPMRGKAKIYNVGGTVDGDEQVGPWANDILAEVHVDAAVLEVGALGRDGDVIVRTPRQAATRRTVLDGASKRVLLATGEDDGGGFVAAAGLEDFDIVISRTTLSPRLVERAAEAGTELVVAG